MALETKLLLKTTQKLVMTATLQQAIKLLPLSRLELIQKVHQEILENPFLEEVATQETSDTELANAELPQETSQDSEELAVDWEAYLQDFSSSPDYVPTISKEVPSLEATLKSETSLAEHLLWQLSLTMHDELEKQIGTYLIGNIDDDGYLQCQTEEVAKGFEVEEEQICAVLEVIQSFDPPGVGARDLQESLLIQLHHLEMDDSLAWKIVQHYLSQLDERYFQKIAKSFGATINEVIAAVYLEEKFRSAIWLMKSVEQRRQTLLRVTKSLCKFQLEFLDKGIAYLKPLVLKDVADDIGMHESTVSRVTTNKYVYTPQGVFELKFFFHSGLESLDGDAMSSVSVKDIIRKAVAAEDSRKPLTDQQLMTILEAKGVKIARRTIAKYRQELHIAPASRRKRLFSH